jgi:hypothetical protein
LADQPGLGTASLKHNIRWEAPRRSDISHDCSLKGDTFKAAVDHRLAGDFDYASLAAAVDHF